jgi:hypothetical protein
VQLLRWSIRRWCWLALLCARRCCCCAPAAAACPACLTRMLVCASAGGKTVRVPVTYKSAILSFDTCTSPWEVNGACWCAGSSCYCSTDDSSASSCYGQPDQARHTLIETLSANIAMHLSCHHAAMHLSCFSPDNSNNQHRALHGSCMFQSIHMGKRIL